MFSLIVRLRSRKKAAVAMGTEAMIEESEMLEIEYKPMLRVSDSLQMPAEPVDVVIETGSQPKRRRGRPRKVPQEQDLARTVTPRSTDNETVVTKVRDISKGFEGNVRDVGPITKDHEHVTKDLQSVTKDHEHVTKDLQSVTKDHEPVTKDHEPVTKDLQSVTKDHEPVTKDIGPVTKGLQPGFVSVKHESVDDNKHVVLVSGHTCQYCGRLFRLQSMWKQHTKVCEKQPIGTKDCDRQPIGSKVYDKQPIGNNDYDRQPIGSKVYDKQPIGNNDYDRQPIGSKVYDKQPIGNNDCEKQPIGSKNSEKQPEIISSMKTELSDDLKQELIECMKQEDTIRSDTDKTLPEECGNHDSGVQLELVSDDLTSGTSRLLNKLPSDNPCDICRNVFKSKARMLKHKFRKHGSKLHCGIQEWALWDTRCHVG